jgi:hypothetical protein
MWENQNEPKHVGRTNVASNINSSKKTPIVHFTIVLGMLAYKVRQHTRADTSKWSRRHHLDNKATPSRRSNTPINNQKTLYGWLGKTFRVSGRLKQIRMIGINPRQLEQTRNIQRRS